MGEKLFFGGDKLFFGGGGEVFLEGRTFILGRGRTNYS